MKATNGQTIVQIMEFLEYLGCHDDLLIGGYVPNPLTGIETFVPLHPDDYIEVATEFVEGRMH